MDHIPLNADGEVPTTPRRIIRRENVVDDTCEMLARLGLRFTALWSRDHGVVIQVGHISRRDVRICEEEMNTTIAYIIDHKLCRTAPHHALVSLPIEDRGSRSRNIWI